MKFVDGYDLDKEWLGGFQDAEVILTNVEGLTVKKIAVYPAGRVLFLDGTLKEEARPGFDGTFALPQLQYLRREEYKVSEIQTVFRGAMDKIRWIERNLLRALEEDGAAGKKTDGEPVDWSGQTLTMETDCGRIVMARNRKAVHSQETLEIQSLLGELGIAADINREGVDLQLNVGIRRELDLGFRELSISPIEYIEPEDYQVMLVGCFDGADGRLEIREDRLRFAPSVSCGGQMLNGQQVREAMSQVNGKIRENTEVLFEPFPREPDDEFPDRPVEIDDTANNVRVLFGDTEDELFLNLNNLHNVENEFHPEWKYTFF